MQITLHADTHTDGSQRTAEHLKNVTEEALGRFGERITRVEAHLSDDNGQARTGEDQIHCTLEARLVGLEPVVVSEHAANAHQAMEGALRRLKRAVGKAIAKHDPRSHRASASEAASEAASEPVGDSVEDLPA